MPRRAASITQAEYARVIRAYLSEGLKPRVVRRPDGSIVFEPVGKTTSEAEIDKGGPGREIEL
jgi:hypothetical protein